MASRRRSSLSHAQLGDIIDVPERTRSPKPRQVGTTTDRERNDIVAAEWFDWGAGMG